MSFSGSDKVLGALSYIPLVQWGQELVIISLIWRFNFNGNSKELNNAVARILLK